MIKEIANYFPADIRDALVGVQYWPEEKRLWRIEAITRQAAARYPKLVKPPETVGSLLDRQEIE